MITFLAAAGTTATLIIGRKLIDRGYWEHRLFRGAGYLALLDWCRELEASGGRVHDLAARDAKREVRFQTVRLVFLNGYPFLLLVMTLAYVAGIPLAVVLGVVGGGLVALALLSDVVSATWVTPTEGARVGRDYWWIVPGIIVRAAVLSLSVALLWLGAWMVERNLFSAFGIGVAAVLVADWCHQPARWIEARRRRGAAASFADHTEDDAVLFLRSFADDHQRMYSPWAGLAWYRPVLPQRARFEEHMAAFLTGTSGSVVAIGRPGEQRPELGAGRTYWTNESWQGAVRTTAARCRAVVMVAGVTDGLGWEVGQLKELGLLGKLLIVMPPDDLDGTWGRYEAIADALGVPEEQRLNNGALLAVTALGFSRNGDLVHYVAAGRDWAGYTLTQLHFFAMLGNGNVDFDGRNSISDAFAQLDDPLTTALYLANQEGLDRARAHIREASDDPQVPRAPELYLAQAWLALEDADPARAGAILDEASDEFPSSADVAEALRVLADWTPGQDPRALLGVRPLSRRAGGTAPSSSGAPRPPMMRLARWKRAAEVAADLGEGDAPEAALAAWQDAERIAGDVIPLAGALSVVGQGDAARELGELDRAEAIGRQVLARGDLVDVRRGIFKLEVKEVYDEAYLLLIRVAGDRGDFTQERRLWIDLHRHRLEGGERELAADAARQLAFELVGHENFVAADEWAAVADRAYAELGLLPGRAAALVTRGRVASHEQRWADADGYFRQALEWGQGVSRTQRANAWVGLAENCRRWAEAEPSGDMRGEAISAYEEVYRMDVEDGEAKSKRAIAVLRHLVDELAAAGRYEAAANRQRNLLESEESLHGRHHATTLRTQRILGHHLVRAGDLAAATDVLRELTSRAEDARTTAAVREVRSLAYRVLDAGEQDAARDAFTALVGIGDEAATHLAEVARASGSHSEEAIAAHRKLVDLWHGMGRYGHALEAQDALVEVMGAAYGAADERTVKARADRDLIVKDIQRNR